jgi:hypothetical protein
MSLRGVDWANVHGLAAGVARCYSCARELGRELDRMRAEARRGPDAGWHLISRLERELGRSAPGLVDAVIAADLRAFDARARELLA